MKVLGKCEFYLLILFVAVLFVVGIAAGDDRTNLSTGDTTHMTKKPTLMILGSGHLANWGADRINYRMDDVLAPKRQAELQALADQLAQFKPTKIAVEVDERWDADLQKEYNGYLKDSFQLEPHEIHQIGFRLAKDMGHPKVYCVDYFRDDPIVREDLDHDLIDWGTFAEANDQKHLLGPPPTGKMTQDEDGKIWIEPEKYEPIIDMYIRINQDEKIRKNLRDYLRIARIGLQDQYPGANWVAHAWYPRNLKTFVNLTRITESEDERILLIIGAGHLGFLKQIAEDSEFYHIESPLQYLEAEGEEKSSIEKTN